MELASKEMAQEVLNYYLRNKEFLKDFDPKREEKFYTIEEQKNMLIEEESLQENDRTYRFFIRLKETNLIIGTVSIGSIVRGAFQSAFLGYKLDFEYLNKGLMTEVVEKIIEISFNELKLHRIEANIMPKNKPSIRVVEKSGFINEGISKKYLLINGEWEDHYHYVKINEDYEK